MPATPAELVPESQVIVIGTVESLDRSGMNLRPEAFLKGPATADVIHFAPNPTADLCGGNPLHAGDRALIYISDGSKPLEPLLTNAYVLRDGRATLAGQTTTEIEVVSAIRSVTGQFAVPAASASEGAGIDWGHTVIPLGVVMALLLGIGLILMRVWHRIDPS